MATEAPYINLFQEIMMKAKPLDKKDERILHYLQSRKDLLKNAETFLKSTSLMIFMMMFILNNETVFEWQKHTRKRFHFLHRRVRIRK
jgi:hypothetical protein